ncbi:hypothetical protein HS962_01410 [Pantoea sp. BIGb0393]|uniref:Uncharacterized protein n=1 Tax=Pantoea nemavictus TaxID=2726955 RepID=A0ABU8PMB2_9GAMM|nr:hypothetical protein [Pantoea nemavictus]MBA0034900.1 hypothetical protein [Pantoea nemavictus]
MNNNKDRDLTHQLNSALPLNNMTPLNEGERFIRIDSVTVMNGDNNDVVTENGTSDGVLFTVRGTALPNEIFFIYVNETRLQVRADREGNWVSHHTPRDLGPIEIKVAIPLTDLSDSFNFTRTEAPIETRPIIHEIYDDEVSYAWEVIGQAATTSDADPIVRGYALAGSEVKVLINGEEVTSTLANDFNNWSLNLPLQEGRNVITVITNGEESEPWEVFYQPAAEPVEPVTPDLAITFMRDVMSGEQIDPNGAATSNSVQLSGTGPADQRFMAYAGNQFIGYVFTDMNGNWSQMLTIPQGSHELTVRSGTERSEAVMITVPAPVPVTPEIHSIWADENTPGLINNGGSTDDNTPQMSGIAGRNATVEVWVNGQHVDTLQADDFGNWHYSPTLSEGMNRIHLVTQGVASETVEVHYAPPAPPVDEPLSILRISDFMTGDVIEPNGSSGNNLIRLSGIGPASGMIQIWSGDTFITSVPASRNGTWQTVLTLPYGENAITLRIPGQQSEPVTITITAPALPVPEIAAVWADENTYGNIENGGNTDDATPQIHGVNVGRYAMVEIWLNGQHIETIMANRAGDWTYSPTLSEGLNQFQVKSQGVASEIFEINYTPAAEVELAIKLVIDGNTFEVIDENGALSGQQVRISGTGPAGAMLSLWSGNTFITDIIPNAAGNWTYFVDLLPGENSLTLRSENASSAPWVVNAPAASLTPPEIHAAWADENSHGQIVNGGNTDDATPRISGRAGSYASVEIWLNGQLVDTTAASVNGSWSYTPTLRKGLNQIVVKTQGVSSESFDIHYAPPAPSVPVITSVWADENNVGFIGNGDTTDDDTLFMRGNNVGSFAEVEIWLHGRRIDTVQADNFGNWSYNLTLGEGRNQIVVKSQGVSSEPYDIHYAPPAPPVPVITSVWADENSHGHIGNGDSTDDATPYIRGHNVGSFAEVEIWLHGRRIDTVQADNFGNWSYHLTLSEGRNQIVVKSQGVSSEPFDIHYAPPAPPVPVITSVWADENSHGHIGNGDSTDDATPYIRGNNVGSFAEVEIWLHGRRIDTVQADNFGNWSYHLTLSEGRNQIVVKSQGVSSEPFDIHYAPPAVPEQPALAITQMQDILTGNPVDPHGTITGRNVILSGTGPRGTIVQIWISDQLVNNVYSGSDGSWSTPIYLLEGENSITVRHAGNQSEAVIITTQNPPPPALEITELLADENGAGPILSGDTTQDATPQLSGIAGAAMLVEIWINDRLVRTVNANRYGEWRYTPTLEEGLNQIVVKSMGVTSEPFEVIYEPLVVPVEPVEPELAITGIRDLATGQILEPNASPDSAEVRLFGKGPANQWVQIWLGDTEIGIALTNGQGEWHKAIDLQLGDNVLTVRVGDQQSEPVLVNVPALNLPVPEIWSVYADEYNPGNLQNGDTTNDDTVQIMGNFGRPFAYFEIWNNDRLVDTQQADQYGRWGYWATLTEGQNNIVVVSRGVSSEPFVIDYQPFEGPATTPAPVIWSIFADNDTRVESGDTTQSSTPYISGRAEPYMRVQLWVNDAMIDAIYADRNGIWHFTPRLTEGVNRIMVKSNGAESDVFELTYQPEVVPVEPVDPVDPELSIVYHNELSDGNTTTAERQSVFSGKAPAGSVITLYLNDQLVTTIEVASTGDWIVSTALFDGVNSLRIGLDGQFSEAVAVTVQGSPAPQILIAQDDQGVAWQLQNNDFTDDAIPQLRGVSAPNAIIQVYVGGQHLGSAQADMSGIWQVDINLNPGRNEIYVVENGVASENFYLTLEDAPVITGLFADGEMHENGGAAGDAELVLHGIAQPGATVEIYDSHSSLPIVITADANGNWSHTVSALIGENTYFAVSRGQWSEAFYFNYIPDLAEPAQPEQPEQPAFPIDMPENIEQYLNVPYITSAYDSVGTMPWLVNSGSWTDDAQPELYGGGARPNVIITILDGDNNVIGSTRTNSKGDWRFTPDEPLSPGQWDFSAANEYGNSGSTFTVNIRDLDPAPNMIAYDDVGDYRGVRPSGSFIDDAMPSFHGGSNPNKLISLYDQNNQLIATTTSNWNGSWTINIETPLLPGTHSFVARDEDGKSSDSLVLNIKTSDDAPWPEISSLLADGDAMLFAAQTESDDQDSFVTLTISEADMAHSSLHDALSSDMVANPRLSIELLDEHQSLTQG